VPRAPRLHLTQEQTPPVWFPRWVTGTLTKAPVAPAATPSTRPCTQPYPNRWGQLRLGQLKFHLRLVTQVRDKVSG
jgi:hypothetical protein